MDEEWVWSRLSVIVRRLCPTLGPTWLAAVHEWFSHSASLASIEFWHWQAYYYVSWRWQGDKPWILYENTTVIGYSKIRTNSENKNQSRGAENIIEPAHDSKQAEGNLPLADRATFFIRLCGAVERTWNCEPTHSFIHSLWIIID